MKRAIVIMILNFILASGDCLYSQILGGQRNNSQSSATETKPSELTSDAIQNNVNLFNGVFTTSYDLGSVTTLEGLTYQLSLDYASKFTGGDNVPITSGIPYGEGWNLGIPTITIDNFSFHNYSEQEELLFDQQLTNGTIVRKNMNRDQLMKEGETFWFSPFINIPGVIAERFIFKYYDNAENRSVFVPHKFSKYVEARFDGQYWEVIDDNGDRYRFDVVQVTTANASNQRVQITDPAEPYDMDLMYNLVVPKSQVVGWYCSEISNPTHTAGQKIYFEYEKFGDYNFFQEYYDPRTAATIGDHFIGPYKLCVPWTCHCLQIPSSLLNYTAYKDILLKKVIAASYSTVLEELELNYKTVDIRALGAQNVLLPSDPGVFRKDSLYNYKAIYSAGIGTNAVSSLNTEATITGAGQSAGSDMSFPGWTRFLHIKAPGSFNIDESENVFSHGTNPYHAIGTNGSYYCKAASLNVSNGDLPFAFGFLESPRIRFDAGGNEIVAGDLYEVKALIRHNNVSTDPGAGFCNFDINVVSGLNRYTEQYNTTGTSRPMVLTLDDSKSYTVFSTFNQPVKWNTRSSLNTTHPGYLITSNYFTLPNIPAEYNGIQVQVGPANSDHNFSRDPSTVSALLASNSPFIPAAAAAYYGHMLTWGLNDLHPTSPIPRNFGMGLPWQMMERFYANYDDGDLDFKAPRNRHWWSGGMHQMSWSNEPTLAGNNVFLAGLALVRHSRNPYMLHSVTKYRTNGEISPLDALGRIAVSKVQMNYSVEIDTLLNNIISNSFTTQQMLHGYHNTILLSEVVSVPVNGVNSNQPVSFQLEDLPRVSYRYSQKRIADYVEKRDNKFLYPMTGIVNQLGGKTEIVYFDLVPGSKNTATVRISMDRVDIMSDNTVLETNLAVKQLRQQKGVNEYAIWDYDYQDQVRVRKSPVNQHIKKHFHLELTDSDVGYRTVTVTEPEINPGQGRNYFVHTYYDDQSPLLFGKIRSTEYFNSQQQRLTKTEFNYGTRLAFMNAAYRSNYQNYHTTDDYRDVTFSILNAGSVNHAVNYDVPVKVGDDAIRFFEVKDAAYFEEDYMNSYFVFLEKKFEYEYDHPDEDRLYDILNSSISEGIADAVNNPINDEMENSVPVERFAGCTASIQPIEILTVTEFKFWDADYLGRTTSPGFKQLIPEFNSPVLELRFEPSFRLFSERRSSPSYPGRFEKTEHYYYYDLKNYDADLIKPSFASAYQSQLHGLRDLRYEERTTSSYTGVDSLSRSSYTFYSAQWNSNIEDLVPMETIPYVGPLTCPGSSGGGGQSGGSGSTSTANVPLECIRAFNASAPPPSGYELRYYNTIAFYCPIGAQDVQPTASQRMIIYNQEPGIPNIGFWVSGKLKYSATVLQSGSVLKQAYQALSRKPASAILAFKDVSVNGNLLTIPEFPFDTLKTDSVIQRTEFGQVKLSSNENGLKTRYFYSSPHLRFYRDYSNPCNSYTAVYWSDIFAPLSVISGYELAEQQQEYFEYYPDNSLKKITTINNEQLLFTYDAFGRLSRKFINNKLYDQYAYSNYHSDDLTSFSQRASQNYIDHWRVQSEDSMLHSRAYLDPAGRTLQQLSQTTTSLNQLTGNMHYSGQVVYDLKGRAVKSYKPFYISRNGLPVHFHPKMNTSDPSLPQLYAESTYDDSKSISSPVRSSDYGVNIQNGHVSTYTTELLNSQALINELNLSLSEQTMIFGNATEFVGRKKISRDEDGKRKIIYENVFGKVIAEKAYAAPLEPVITLYSYDNAGNISQIVNPAKQPIHYYHNIHGWKYKEIHPDKGTTTIMFNRSGKPVMMQDANGKEGSENNGVVYCRIFTYDEFGRLVKQFKTDLPSFNPVNYELDPAFPQYSFSTGQTCSWIFGLHVQVPGGMMYKDFMDFTSGERVEKEYYYDEKVTPGSHAASANIHNILLPALDQKQQNLKGRLSWSCQFIEGTPQYLTFLSYDSTGNISHAFHQFNNEGISSASPGIIVGLLNAEYDRYSNSLRTELDFNIDGMAEKTFIRSFDARGRLRAVSIDGVMKAVYGYNEQEQMIAEEKYYLGQDKTCDELLVDQISYNYDQRRRLTDINSRFFNENLYYDNFQLMSLNGVNPVNAGANYNGNINSIRSVYKLQATATPSILQPTDYGYRYDQLNRLLNADANIYDNLQPGTASASRYRYGDERFEYDNVGNIETLNRWMFYPYSNFNPSNDKNEWNYIYQSGNNRLNSIDSAGVNLRGYTYDPNGNMVSDGKRGITFSEFNSADLPCKLMANGDVIEYAYGVHDLRIYKEDGVNESREFYLRDTDGKELGIYNYQSDSWKLYLNGLNRVGEMSDEIRFFEYDHLGNTRVSYKATSNCISGTVDYTIKGVFDYYPSGKVLRSFVSGERDKYLTTGNERDQESGLDYRNARFSDSEIGMFRSVDPLKHLLPGWSSYSSNYCNSIQNVDPDGQIPWPVMKKWVTSTGTTIIRRIDSEFGMRTLNGRTRQHSGLDMNLGGGRQDLGVPIYSTHDGIVKINRDKSDKNAAGNRVHIESKDRTLKTVYMHMKAPSTLVEGTEVKEGDIVGYIGGTANGQDNVVDGNGKRTAGTDVHLHYELHQKNAKGEFVPINPLNDDGTLKDPQKILGLPSNQLLHEDLKDNRTNIKSK